MVDFGPGYTEHEHDGLPRYKPKAKPGEWDMSFGRCLLYLLGPSFALTAIVVVVLLAMGVV